MEAQLWKLLSWILESCESISALDYFDKKKKNFLEKL